MWNSFCPLVQNLLACILLFRALHLSSVSYNTSVRKANLCEFGGVVFSLISDHRQGSHDLGEGGAVRGKLADSRFFYIYLIVPTPYATDCFHLKGCYSFTLISCLLPLVPNVKTQVADRVHWTSVWLFAHSTRKSTKMVWRKRNRRG